jgi:integrase
VYRRDDGRWTGQVSLGVDPATGRRRRKTVYGATRAEVVAQLKDLTRAADDGEVVVTDGRATVEDFVKGYIATALEAQVAAGRVKRSTAEWHAAMLRHVCDRLGKRRLDSLVPADVERLTVDLSRAGLSSSTVKGVHVALRKALGVALRDGLVRRNVAAAVPAPTVVVEEARFLGVEGLRSLIAAAEGRMRLAVVLLTLTGMRRGELLALRWSDVDLEAGTVSINGTLSRTKADGLARTAPKSRASRRTVLLPPMAVAELAAARAARPALPSAPVVPNRTGGFWDPRGFTRAFAKTADEAGVDCGVHSLRHSAATAMIAQGATLKTVSDVLGHADIRVTADVYGHVIDEQRRAAAAGIERALTADGWQS